MSAEFSKEVYSGKQFKFNTCEKTLNREHLQHVDIDQVVSQLDVGVLQKYLKTTIYSNLDRECCHKCMTPIDPTVLKLFRLAQLSLEWYQHCQESVIFNFNQLKENHDKLEAEVTELKDYNQRLQSSYEAYVVNQQENKRLCEKTTTLQQEIMQMQISGLVQENGALQTKVTEQNTIQLSIKSRHEIEKNKLLSKLNNMQSSMSKLQERIQTKKKKNKRLEYQIASLLKEKRLQLEKEKSWKQQTTMTKQEQIIPAWSKKDAEVQSEIQHKATSYSKGDSSSQWRPNDTFSLENPSSEPEVQQRGDSQCPSVYCSTSGLRDKVESEASPDELCDGKQLQSRNVQKQNRKLSEVDEWGEKEEKKQEKEEQKEEEEEQGTELIDASHCSVAESSSETSPNETKPSSAPSKTPTKTSLLKSSSPEEDRMTEAKEQPKKHQSGEPERPSEITTLLTVGPEENLKSTESEAGSTTLDLCEKLQQKCHLMKDQRPNVEKCFMERMNKLGIKPDQTGLKKDEYTSLLCHMQTDRNRSKVGNSYYNIKAVLHYKKEKKTLMKMPPDTVLGRRKTFCKRRYTCPLQTIPEVSPAASTIKLHSSDARKESRRSSMNVNSWHNFSTESRLEGHKISLS